VLQDFQLDPQDQWLLLGLKDQRLLEVQELHCYLLVLVGRFDLEPLVPLEPLLVLHCLESL
jgi:hypothetical protein